VDGKSELWGNADGERIEVVFCKGGITCGSWNERALTAGTAELSDDISVECRNRGISGVVNQNAGGE